MGTIELSFQICPPGCAIPVTRVSDVLWTCGGWLIWYSREIGLCPPCTWDTPHIWGVSLFSGGWGAEARRRRTHHQNGIKIPFQRWVGGGGAAEADPPLKRDKNPFSAVGGWRKGITAVKDQHLLPFSMKWKKTAQLCNTKYIGNVMTHSRWLKYCYRATLYVTFFLWISWFQSLVLEPEQRA